MTTAPIRLGTRRSALAMAQSSQVARALERVSGRSVELVQIVSEGDASRASLSQLGGTGVFATRLRDALRADECDLLVHSLKDLPTADAPGLLLAATPERADARDVVLTRDGTALADLAPGATVGTGSPRRIAQVRGENPGVEVRDLRGNVDSRMRRVRDGELDAIVLAAAGLSRLGAEIDLVAEPRDLAAWPAAAGQGSLAVETRADADAELLETLRALDDPRTRFAVIVERAILAGVEAGCHAPVGVHAVIDDDELRVRAAVYGAQPGDEVVVDRAEPLAQEYIRPQGSGKGADAASRVAHERASGIGALVAGLLLDRGAAELISPSTAS
ncbi:hydroxymethylbilane synthase [Microbacterium betulae]|uniref:Hydroxymethylbilane synthase n=1 Tax=Microbacterium betulae TaxID=2981139 RepID=A0AA97FJF5_9MICO|nr:hydroxymethylbilane synthase [Microbacterium sp. AB]WOF23390.1 hydroxymethylbilane synthase [Microbacterium sp. AB]